MKKVITSSQAPAPVGPYSQAIECNGFIFCSGQIPLTAAGELKTDSIEMQTQQIMENITAVLNEAGLGIENIVKTGIFLTNMDDFNRVNEVYASFFPAVPPARSCVEVSRLPKGVQVEIEVVAFRS